MKKGIILICVLHSFMICGQSLDRSVVAAGGSYVQLAGFSISSTIGEVAASSLLGASSILTQGFQQPDGLFVGIVDPQSREVLLNAFPNPVSSRLTLEINSSGNSKLRIRCLDLLGRDVLPMQSEYAKAGEVMRLDLDVSHLVPAMYFICVDTGIERSEMKVLRIIKSN